MIAAVALTLALFQEPKTLDVTPSADAWIYPHSDEPGQAELLRVWGNGSDSMEKDVPPTGECSYAYFDFPVSGLKPELYKVTEAKLVVYFNKTEDLTAEAMKSFPLEAHALDLVFTDKDIHVDTLKKGPEAAIFGKGTTAEASGTDKYKMTIDLMGKDSPFGEWFEKSIKPGQIGIALTSTIFPGDSRGALYRISSKEGAKELTPHLIVKVAPR